MKFASVVLIVGLALSPVIAQGSGGSASHLLKSLVFRGFSESAKGQASFPGTSAQSCPARALEQLGDAPNDAGVG